jgi:histone-lysine N-methyltransferase SETMAR
MLIIFFNSQGIVHTELIPEVKTVNAPFYKGVIDRLLKHIQRVCPAVFCSRDFFLLHDNVPTHKAASVCQFFTQKNVTTLYHPPYSPDLSPPDYFLFPKLKMKLKGLHFADVAVIQDVVTDELKKVQKEEFSAAFQKMYDQQKPVHMPMALILNKNRGMCFTHVFNLKKISPKTFGPHCVCT